VPDEPVRLRNEVLLDVGGSLADSQDSEAVFPAALADLDQQVPRLADAAALRNVLVDLLDHQQERLLHLLLLDEQLAGDLPEQLIGHALVEIARDVENDGDVLLEGDGRHLFGVFRPDLDVALLVGSRVEHLVLLFEPVVLPIGVDDEEGIARLESSPRR